MAKSLFTEYYSYTEEASEISDITNDFAKTVFIKFAKEKGYSPIEISVIMRDAISMQETYYNAILGIQKRRTFYFE